MFEQRTDFAKAQVVVTARDRVALLLDEDSPFLELAPFAGYENPDSTPAASLVTGIGLVKYTKPY